MSVEGLCKRVSSLGFALVGLGYAIDAQSHVLSTFGRIKSLSWNRDMALPLMQPQLPKIDDYLSVVREQDYSFLMRDGAVIQILYRYEGSEPIKHRLLYWPCSFDGTTLFETIEQPIIDVIEASFLRDLRSETILRGAIRFDYARDEAREWHPASHLTVAIPECRIPVHSPLSFDTFMRFVLENFYNDAWLDRKVRANFNFEQEARCLQTSDSHRIHLAWQYA